MDQNLEHPTDQIIDIKSKESTINKQKNIFSLWSMVFLILLSLLLLGAIGLVVYRNYFRSLIATPTIVTPVEDNPEQPKSNPEVDITKKIQYKSDNLKLSLEYPKEAKLIDTWGIEGQTKKLEIFYDRDITNYDNIKDEDVKSGYVFRVSTFNTAKRNLQEITQTKMDGFKNQCQASSSFSKIRETTFQNINAFAFDIKNCNGDLTVTYISKFGTYYEFIQIYRGDIGYRQVFNATTKEIASSVRFYPDNMGPAEPYETYNNDDYKFSFRHPRFNRGCCDITGPISEYAEKLIVLGDPNNITNKTTFDGFGVFYDSAKKTNTYQQYLDNQKKYLIDDYVVVKGKQPQPVEKMIKVGNKDAYMLSGFSWRGNDLIYVDLTNYSSPEINFRGKVLVISVQNLSGPKFEEKIDDILSSFEFK